MSGNTYLILLGVGFWLGCGLVGMAVFGVGAWLCKILESGDERPSVPKPPSRSDNPVIWIHGSAPASVPVPSSTARPQEIQFEFPIYNCDRLKLIVGEKPGS